MIRMVDRAEKGLEIEISSLDPPSHQDPPPAFSDFYLHACVCGIYLG